TEAFWKTKNKTDAVGMAAEAKKQSDAITTAVAQPNWDAIKAAAGPLGQQCAGCHGTYRERLADGSVPIKRTSSHQGRYNRAADVRSGAVAGPLRRRRPRDAGAVSRQDARRLSERGRARAPRGSRDSVQRKDDHVRRARAAQRRVRVGVLGPRRPA